MKRVALFFSLVLCAGIFCGCKKGGGGGSSSNEANLVVEIDPANGTVQTPSLGPFNLKVTITSVMPSGGVKIEISAKKDDGSGTAPFFTSTSNTSTNVSNFNIVNTTTSVQCLVEIKVTSLSKSSNQWPGSYRYSRK